MSQIVANAAMIKELAAATGPVQIVDAEGKVLGLCMPSSLPKAPAFSPEYIEERRKALEPIRERIRQNPKCGKSLREIIANLEQRAGEAT